MTTKTTSAIQHLKDLKHSFDCQKHPNISVNYVPVYNYSDKTANGLTRCIVDFLNLSGHQAERINTMGRMIDNSFEFTDALGFRRKAGGVKWVKGTTTKGSADISAIISGKAVKIEVKVGKDRIRPDQITYAQSVIQAGGVYIIARNFEEFYQWYLNYMQ